VRISSPLEYLAEIPDLREYLKTEHQWEDPMLMSLMALGSGRKNILAIAQWIEDEQRYLLNELEIRNRYRERTLPAQATISHSQRYFWNDVL